ncbi:nuclear transport factor 2-like [Gigantopelta aegis]|uniref:nuclear transport factor 2-like n=1 Tax=Gigantopelta aegis TaxID=1735272 RepID=UPI001B889FB0|nr:nuclear transport factor 2-like [Gigantopelta aegis]
MADAESQFCQSVASAFVDAYYQKFDNPSTRPELVDLYTAEAKLTFEGTQTVGQVAIREKLGTIPLGRIQRAVTVVDSQVIPGLGVLIQVIGQLQNEQDKALGFSHSFILKSMNNSFFIDNEIFRLALYNFPDSA